MFPHINRLTESKEIQKLISTGKRYTTPHFRVYWAASHQPQPRLTVVVSKKTAKFAVSRNRIKRRVRAALRGLQELPAINVVVFPNQKVLALPFDVLVDELTGWQKKL